MSETATQQTKEQKPAPIPPAYGRPIQEIIRDLSTEVPAKMLSQKKMGGSNITFLPWYRAARMLDWYAPGWSFEIRNIQQVANQCVVVVRLNIPAAEGIFFREATGIEDEEVKGYGDVISNASGMALRRAAALFGLGRHLYEK